VTATNNAASPAPVDLWLDATGPVSRTILLGSGTLPAGATVTRNVRLRIPGATPNGTYNLALNLGEFPDDVCDSEAFVLTVGAPRLPANEVKSEVANRASTSAPERGQINFEV